MRTRIYRANFRHPFHTQKGLKGRVAFRCDLGLRDAIDRINDGLRQSAKIIKYVNDEIKEFYANLLKREDLEIAITFKKWEKI